MKLEERKLNGNEKVTVSFLNYRSTKPSDFHKYDSSGENSLDDEELDDDAKELRNTMLESKIIECFMIFFKNFYCVYYYM